MLTHIWLLRHGLLALTFVAVAQQRRAATNDIHLICLGIQEIKYQCDTNAVRDCQVEREEKLRMVAIYNARLTERERRRAYVAERGLLNVKAQQARWLSLSRLCAHARFLCV